jgi:hypothetical protein
MSGQVRRNTGPLVCSGGFMVQKAGSVIDQAAWRLADVIAGRARYVCMDVI